MDAEGIVRILNAAGCEKVKASGQNVWTRCPLAPWTHEKGYDGRPSCSVKINDQDTSVFICWGCKESGTFATLLRRLNEFRGGGLEHLIDELEETDSANLSSMLTKALVKSRDAGMQFSSYSTPAEWVLDERSISDFIGKVPQYVLDRGVTLESCEAWELGYDEDPEDPRLVFPVRDYERRLVGVVGRSLHPHPLVKYKNYEGFHGAHYLYGEDRLNLSDPRPIVLVEGMLDTIVCWQHGLCQAMGIFGSRITPAKSQKIEMLVGSRPVFTLFDPDSAGDDARDSVDQHLGGKLSIFHRKCPEEKDPAELDKVELEAILSPK